MSSCRCRIWRESENDISLRVITDHIRSVTFMISDGILPSNSGRGYVLRRLLRRASRHGRLLGIDRQFLEELAETVIEDLRMDIELEEKKDFIFKVIVKEEEQFNKTIDRGLSILAQAVEEMEQKNEKVMSGEEAFRLYDTYGFPVDLTIEILEEKGFSIDEEGFGRQQKSRKKKQRERSVNIIIAEEKPMFMMKLIRRLPVPLWDMMSQFASLK